MIKRLHFAALAVAFAVGTSNGATIALYDFEAGGSGNNFAGQNGLKSVDTEPDSTATILTTGGPQGLDGGGANNIFNNAQTGSVSGPPVTNWGNGGNPEGTANFAQFTTTPDSGLQITYESLSLYHAAFNLTPKFKITYAIGTGPDVEALAPTSHTSDNIGTLDFLSEDFVDFTTSESVTWKIHVFDADDNNTGSRFDDITINGTVAPVPEPSTLALVVAGVLSLGLVVRNQRKRA